MKDIAKTAINAMELQQMSIAQVKSAKKIKELR